MTQWKTYEDVGTFLLNQFAVEFGLDLVESKQDVPGQSGTTWEIDAKGVVSENEGFLVIEFRRHTTARLSQQDMGSLAYTIRDTGAKGGIIVSPLDLQKGAKMVAAAENVIKVTLNEKCNRFEYVMEFLGKIKFGVAGKGGVVLGGAADVCCRTPSLSRNPDTKFVAEIRTLSLPFEVIHDHPAGPPVPHERFPLRPPTARLQIRSADNSSARCVRNSFPASSAITQVGPSGSNDTYTTRPMYGLPT